MLPHPKTLPLWSAFKLVLVRIQMPHEANPVVHNHRDNVLIISSVAILQIRRLGVTCIAHSENRYRFEGVLDSYPDLIEIRALHIVPVVAYFVRGNMGRVGEGDVVSRACEGGLPMAADAEGK
jgi:hypothetical protein